MTVRTVSVRVQASISDYTSKPAVASKATTDFADKVEAAQGRTAAGYKMIGTGLLVAGGLVAAGLAVAERAAISFDSKMALVQTLSRATAAEMLELRKAAETMGQGIGYSADQVADAQAELVKAGISVKDILGGALKGALDLAAAGQTDVAEATETAAIAMKQFGLSGKDVPHIADLLAAGADRALGSVSDLSYGLRSGGTEAAQMGLSIEETVGVLAEFAQSGQIGQRGGTVLRQMLISLVNPSHEAAQVMSQYGIAVYDTNGKFVTMTQLAGELHDKLGNLTAQQRNLALNTIFGAHAVNGANILFAEGAKGTAEWTKKVDTAGFAALQASGKLNSLAGDWTKLRSALNTSLINGGESGMGPLRRVTQDATGLVDAWNRTPGPLKAGAEALTAIGGAAAIAGAGILLLPAKIAVADAALAEMTDGALTTSAALAGIGKAGLAALAIFAAFKGADIIGHDLESNAPSVDKLTLSLTNFAKTGKATGQLVSTFGPDLKNFASQLKLVAAPSIMDSLSAKVRYDPVNWITGVGTHIDEARKNFAALDTVMAKLVTGGHLTVAEQAYGELSARAQVAGVSTKYLAKALPSFGSALDASQASAKLAANGVDQFGNSTIKAAKATDAAATSAKNYDAALHALADPVFAMQSALAGLASAQETARKATDKYGSTSKQAKAANLDLATSALKVEDAATTLAGSIKDGTTSTSAMNHQLKLWVAQGALTQKQADSVSTSVAGIIKQGQLLSGLRPTLRINAETAAAKRQLQDLLSLRNQLSHQVTIGVLTASGGSEAERASHAAGGFITGAGTGTSDSILALLSNGEYVMPADKTSRYRGVLEAMRAGQYVGRYASGGMVLPAGGGGSTAGDKVSARLLSILGDRGSSSAQIQAAIAAVTLLSTTWQNTIQSISDASQKRGLVKALSTAQSSLDKALKATGKDAASQVKTARDQVTSATKALHQFETQARQAAVSRKIDAATARLQAAETLATNKEAYRFDAMTQTQQIAYLAKRMAGEKRYSTQWLSDEQQRASLIQSERQAIAQQQQTFEAAIDPTQQTGVGFAPSIADLLSNGQQGLADFNEWLRQLAVAKSKGVSKAAVAMLGLDSGPGELAELLEINKGTPAQVAALNALAASRASVTKNAAAAAVGATLFDDGGRWPSGTLGLNLSGHDEWVTPSATSAPMPAWSPAGGGGSVFAAGAVQVTFTGPVDSTTLPQVEAVVRRAIGQDKRDTAYDARRVVSR